MKRRRPIAGAPAIAPRRGRSDSSAAVSAGPVSYPGVYVEEIASRARAITGVPTSVAAFVGYAGRGPVDEARQIFSFADFERIFGGLHADSMLSYAVNHFFLNGGGTCWVVRIAENAEAAGGGVPTESAGRITGTRGSKTGIYALEDVDLFNILCIPGVTDVTALGEATAYAEERRAMLIADIDANVNTLDDAQAWINDDANAALKRSNAVAYFPRVRLADPLQNGRLRSFPNSGPMAGLWARTDNQRGVWKAPAGIEATLHGVQALDCVLSDQENGVLNPLGLNCLRTFPAHGTVSWGARTLVGADARTSEWKYIPVRRSALFIEESLYRGTQFAALEPNDEPLWAQIRLKAESFMNNLFRQGAFQGASPQEAYFVKCDSTTTTQGDINLGIVNIHVGFAPLKPAEFVIITIQQIAGRSPA